MRAVLAGEHPCLLESGAHVRSDFVVSESDWVGLRLPTRGGNLLTATPTALRKCFTLEICGVCGDGTAVMLVVAVEV